MGIYQDSSTHRVPVVAKAAKEGRVEKKKKPRAPTADVTVAIRALSQAIIYIKGLKMELEQKFAPALTCASCRNLCRSLKLLLGTFTPAL